MAKQKPSAGPETRDERVDPGAGDQTTITNTAAGGDAAERNEPDTGTAGASQGAPGTDASATATGFQPIGEQGPELHLTGGPTSLSPDAAADAGVPPRIAVPSPMDSLAAVRARAAEEAARERARRYQEIPVEGVVIEADDLDLLAVHLDLDPGTVIAARQYRDRLVYVTRDGRKVEKGMR